MNNMITVMDGFVKDENGKFHIVPMKLPECMKPASSTKKSEGKRRSPIRRKYIPIEPLVLTAADFGESPQNVAKKRKIDKPVRKELFKVPQKKTGSRLSSYNRFSVTPSLSMNKLKRNSIKNASSNKKKDNLLYKQSEGCALLDIDENEELPNQKNQLKNSVKTVLFPIVDTSEKEKSSAANHERTPPLKILDKNEMTPTSAASVKAELEFLELEKTLASVTKNKKSVTVSPMTSVCALLESTKITNTGKNEKNKNNILSDVLSLIKEDMEQFELLKQQFESYQQEHEKKFSKIVELVGSLEEDKENTRRSLRIANQNGRNKFVISPAIANKVDLRKTTLNKNLSRNLQYESPRTRKAVDMYNAMRNDCSVLCTPKLDRKNIDLPQASVTRSLSRRIQKQCLLLQDTPKPGS